MRRAEKRSAFRRIAPRRIALRLSALLLLCQGAQAQTWHDFQIIEWQPRNPAQLATLKRIGVTAAAVIADRDGFFRGRIGNANPLLYLLYNLDYHEFFHDITGIGTLSNNNGLFPTTRGYDLATGIGSPKMGAMISGVPER